MKIQRKINKLEAIQWTGNNIQSINCFVRDNMETHNPIIIDCNFNNQLTMNLFHLANEGDYLYLDIDGKIKSISFQEVEDDYDVIY